MRVRDSRGFAIVDLLFTMGIIGILSAIALPRLAVAKNAANAGSAIGSLRVIISAELSFSISCGGGFYAPNLTTLGTAPPGSTEPFIFDDLGHADIVGRSGYSIEVFATSAPGSPGSCNGVAAGQLGQGFKAGATAIDPVNPRSFATNANGVIWEDVAPLFPAMPEAGDPAAGYPLIR
jgi:type II secretory pathway pseudopilin PulG